MSILLVSEKFVSVEECIHANRDSHVFLSMAVYPDNVKDCFRFIRAIFGSDPMQKEKKRSDIVFVDVTPVMAVALANFTKLYMLQRRIGLYVKPGVVEWFD